MFNSILKIKTVDEVGVDELGVDEMGVEEMASRRSGNKPIIFRLFNLAILTYFCGLDGPMTCCIILPCRKPRRGIC